MDEHDKIGSIMEDIMQREPDCHRGLEQFLTQLGIGNPLHRDEILSIVGCTRCYEQIDAILSLRECEGDPVKVVENIYAKHGASMRRLLDNVKQNESPL